MAAADVARGGAGGAAFAETKDGGVLSDDGGAGSAAEGDEPVNIKVKVNVAGKTFVVPCGRGQQSVKWLATVVAQRYQMMTQNRGRQRHREAQLEPPGFFLPSAVRVVAGARKDAPGGKEGDDGVTFPATRVRDVCASNAVTELDVALEREYVLAEDGSKKQTTWAAMAFNFSDAGRRRAEAKRRADLARAEDARRAEAEEAALKEKANLDEMAKLLATDLDNPAALEEALTRDWTHVRVERITENPDEIGNIKKLLLQNFVAISDIYRVYSAFHPGSSAVAMCKQEFNHVVIVCQIAHSLKDRGALEKIFVEANGDRNDDPSDSTRFLTRFEFMEALLLLAWWKFSGPPANLTPSKCVEKLLDKHILPRAAKMAMGTVRKTLASEPVVKHITACAKKLRAAFDHYKSLDSDSSPESMFSINFTEFIEMLKDCNMVDEERRVDAKDRMSGGRNVLSNQEIQELFAAVQRDDEGPPEKDEPRSPGRAGSNESLQELVFGEFLEAVARCGMETWEDHRLPLEIRMQMGFDAVCKLVKDDGTIAKLSEDEPLPDPEDYFDFRKELPRADSTPFVTQGATIAGVKHMSGVE
uniref:Uncharacterized protein n=1 Tax=Bicosoecida sp. CB-2014 TaxID=1486930 RepID=A0A7S1GBQ0_9STRA|mmetsp:Transcript_27601/g.95427  ORF Transcript_27601/g.95427 Transcript_27601/m.95427 type:complete len:587 (+) Transcript_27601:254-2014(+)